MRLCMLRQGRVAVRARAEATAEVDLEVTHTAADPEVDHTPTHPTPDRAAEAGEAAGGAGAGLLSTACMSTE